MGHVHVPVELLVALVSGRLPASESDEVPARMRGCQVCEQELAGWRAVALAVGAAAPRRVPSPAVLDAVLRRVSSPVGGGSVFRRRVGIAVALVGCQVALVRRGIWAVSALMFALGAAVCLSRHGQPGVVLSLVAPLIAALGVCVVYGPEVDPGVEIAAAAPTSARVVLLARLALVAGYDLVLALAVTGVVRAFGAVPSFWPLVSAWLGPLALLSALSLLLAVWWGPTVGAVAAFALWGARVLASQVGDAGVLSDAQAAVIARAWGTSVPVLAVAALLGALAIALAPHRVRLA